MQPLHPLVQKLLDLETLKTWSLIVTLFGDFDGDHLTGSQIRDLLGHLGIKPEAIRVALHRLKADGWITAEKQGREAIYRLTPMGRKETDAAARDVYRRDIKFPQGWQFYLSLDEVDNALAIAISKELSLAPAEMADELGAGLVLILAPAPAPARQDVPRWIEEQLVPQALLQTAQTIVDVLRAAPRAEHAMADLDARCLRLLVVHNWRRLALRHGTWAHIGLLPDGGLAACQAVVTGFLGKP